MTNTCTIIRLNGYNEIPCFKYLNQAFLCYFFLFYKFYPMDFHFLWGIFTQTNKWKYDFTQLIRGWSGGAKVSCILRQRGVQLIFAYSWTRPAILVAGKGGGGMFLFLLFLHFHSCSSFFPVPLFHLFNCLSYLFSPFLWETTQNDPQGLNCR